MCIDSVFVFLFKQKTAYEMRISDWSSDVCSSDLATASAARDQHAHLRGLHRRELERITTGRGCGIRFKESRKADMSSSAAAPSSSPRTRRPRPCRSDRKSVVEGKSVYTRVDLGGRRIITKKKTAEKKAKKQ